MLWKRSVPANRVERRRAGSGGSSWGPKIGDGSARDELRSGGENTEEDEARSKERSLMVER